MQQAEYGGIAQLGERLNGIQEVSGSIPLISTIEALKTIGFQGFLLFEKILEGNLDRILAYGLNGFIGLFACILILVRL